MRLSQVEMTPLKTACLVSTMLILAAFSIFGRALAVEFPEVFPAILSRSSDEPYYQIHPFMGWALWAQIFIFVAGVWLALWQRARSFGLLIIWLLHLSWVAQSSGSTSGTDVLLSYLLLSLALTSFIKAESRRNIYLYVLLWLQTFLIYWVSFKWKLLGAEWREGLALFYAPFGLNFGEPKALWVMANLPQSVLQTMTYAGVLLELLIPFGLLFSRSKKFAAAVMVLIHLSLVFVFKIHIFSFLMIWMAYAFWLMRTPAFKDVSDELRSIFSWSKRKHLRVARPASFAIMGFAIFNIISGLYFAFPQSLASWSGIQKPAWSLLLAQEWKLFAPQAWSASGWLVARTPNSTIDLQSGENFQLSHPPPNLGDQNYYWRKFQHAIFAQRYEVADALKAYYAYKATEAGVARDIQASDIELFLCYDSVPAYANRFSSEVFNAETKTWHRHARCERL